METNDGKAEKFFKDFGKKVDQFILEAKDAGSRLEVDLQKKYDELKATAEKLKSEAENKERWKEVEVSLISELVLYSGQLQLRSQPWLLLPLLFSGKESGRR